MAFYTADISWKLKDGEDFAKGRYSRGHTVSFDGGTIVPASASPPVRFPNVYGIDMPARSELIATGKTVDQLAKNIGADELIFQDLEDLKQAITEAAPGLTHFDTSVFDGVYVTGDITEEYLNTLEQKRNDAAKHTEDVASHITRNLSAHL